MSENRLPGYLDQMLEAAQQACSYVKGLDKGKFLVDKRIQQAVILNLVIIGEATTKLLKVNVELQKADNPTMLLALFHNQFG